jgi:putative cell wall-binding protein
LVLIKSRVGAPKRIAAGTLAAALSLFGLALAPSAGAAASVTTARIAGADRYATAQTVATDASLTGGTMAILASGADANFPDALAASGLAGANAPAPIVLTEPTVYTAAAKAALATLKGKGVTAVTIVGGTDAVSATVATAVTADGFTVTRVAGVDRYETAGAIAAAQNTKKTTGSISSLKAAFIATGANFPDALAAGPAAYSGNLPILLVNSTGVPAATTKAITDLGIKKVYILGGTDAIPATVEATLVTQTGNPATRVAGTDRNDTATKVADFEKTNLSFVPTEVVLATGLKAADALAVGPLAGQRKAPILLTASIPPVTASWLDANSSTITKITATGGTDAISDADLASAKASAETVSNDSAAKAVTTRPELTGAQVTSTVLPTQATPTSLAGTYVRYTFDKVLGTGFAPSAGLFKVWSSGDTVYTGVTATVETTAPATGNSVLVRFSDAALQTTAGAAALSKATVAFNAVRDAAGAENPEGDASIGTAGTSTTAAGTTSAPDLLSIGGFRQASSIGQTAVDFTFDQAAFVATTTAFHLVTVSNVIRDCTAPAGTDITTTSGGTVAGGNGTTVITAVCNNVDGTTGSVAGTALSASNIARGYVVMGGVGTTAAAIVFNPLEATRSGGAGSSIGPDLLSVVYNGTTAGTATFTFDMPISNATSTNFRLYRTDGAEVAGSGTPTINSSNTTQVAVTFAAAAAGTSYVGGSAYGDTVLSGADLDAVRATDGSVNASDAIGFAGTSSTVSPGRTAGPDLTAVALSAITDVFGNNTGWAALYTFDSTATSVLTVNQSGFHLYLADGTRYTSTTCAGGTGAVGSTALNTVRCTVFINAATGAAISAAAPNTLQGAVLGTNEASAVTDPGTSLVSPEGAAVTTGGNGTPRS